MVYAVETTYGIRALGGVSGDRTELARALGLYAQFTPVSERTSTNEILYWADRYDVEFEDRLLLLGLYRNDELIGFAEVAWFRHEKIVVLDYLTLRDAYWVNSTFFAFLEQIKALIERSGFEFDYIATEIPLEPDGKADAESEVWIHLLRTHAFGLVEAHFETPQLGPTNFESHTNAALMLFCQGGTRRIKPDTYRLIAKTILRKHYLRWYTPFLGEQTSDYEASIDQILQRIDTDLDDRTDVSVNGSTRILPTTVPQDATAPPLREFVLPSVAVVLLLVATIAGITYALDFPPSTTALIFGTAVATYLALVAVVSNRAFHVFDRILSVRRHDPDTGEPHS